MWELLVGAFLGKMLLGGACECPEDEDVSDDARNLASIEPGYHLRPVWTFDEQTSVRFLVRSSEPIDVYFLCKSESEKWLKSEKFKALDTFHDMRFVKNESFVARRGSYALLLVNNGEKTAAVSYGLWSRS